MSIAIVPGTRFDEIPGAGRAGQNLPGTLLVGEIKYGVVNCRR